MVKAMKICKIISRGLDERLFVKISKLLAKRIS